MVLLYLQIFTCLPLALFGANWVRDLASLQASYLFERPRKGPNASISCRPFLVTGFVPSS